MQFALQELLAEEQLLKQKAQRKRGKKTRPDPPANSGLRIADADAKPPEEDDANIGDVTDVTDFMLGGLLERRWQGSCVEDLSVSVEKLRHNFPMHPGPVGMSRQRSLKAVRAVG